MKTYRLFTNDRGMRNGIPMYSALKEVKATSAQAARKKCPPAFDAPQFAPAKAIEWPPQSASSREWLTRHVG